LPQTIKRPLYKTATAILSPSPYGIYANTVSLWKKPISQNSSTGINLHAKIQTSINHSHKGQNMKISAKAEYACIALMELAAHYTPDEDGEPVRIKAISERHSIPPRFLVQILLQLKGAGILSSTRGASGGYNLKRNPAQITLAEVMRIIEAPPTTAKRATTAPQATNAAGILQEAWDIAEKKRQAHLGGLTFAELARRMAR
jgi:Rrf2 family protein